MVKLIITTLIGLGIFNSSLAQTSFTLKAKGTKDPLIGATAMVIGLDGDEIEQLIADGDGVFNTQASVPFQAEIRYVGFKTSLIAINRPGQTVLLEPSVLKLDAMVVTGQFEPQSIDQSVHTVKAIHRKQMEAQGAIDLADVLSNSLNITLTPNKANGRTSISMLGLDGQYVKVLIDGIPFPSVDGNGNNVDITQINLNTIERIEIVEGPMAVSYGANAFAGVINLITKSSVHNSVSIQEETVGPEYGFKKGRHIQTINLGKSFDEHWTVQADFQRNDFRGFLNGYEGEEHAASDEQRGFDWHPKLQYATNAGVTYKNNNFRTNYHFSFFSQTLDLYSRIVFQDEHVSSGIANPFALDDRNETNRFSHNLSLSGQIGRKERAIGFHVVSAFTKVEMTQLTLRKRILTEVEEEITNEEISYLKSFTSRGNFTNFLKPGSVDLELGYEYTYESVDGANIDERGRSLDNLAGFANLEWSPAPALMIRPGLRTFYNSVFPSPLIYSMNVKYAVPGGLDFRASFGRSYRTPNITELYYYFVDANHDVRGNAALIPEDGYGASLDLKMKILLGGLVGSSSLKVFYNNLKDQITLGIVNEAPLQYRYINVARFKSKGLSFSNQFEWNRLTLTAGASYIGRFNQFIDNDGSLNEFLFSPEVNLNSIYTFEKPRLSLALFYKHTGRVEQYVRDEDGEFQKGKTNAFNWLDFSSTWSLRDHLEFQGGIKNILDLTDVQTTSGQAGAHSAAPTSVGLTYGRSYFLRITYNF